MEIDFMILWKNKILEQKDLLEKVSQMLETIFPNTKSNELCYIDKNNKNCFLPYNISNDSNKVVYLKIECGYSDAKSSEILSVIRDKLCAGPHRANFSIICTYDDASLSFCCRLMNPFGVFERRLREIVYLTTVKAFGVNWVAETFPDELQSKIKEKTKGISDEKLTEKALEFLDYSQLISYLFEKKRHISPEQVIDEKFSDYNLENLTKEELIEIVRDARPISLWDELFFDNENLKSIKGKIDEIRCYRNHTMHHHTMDIDTFKMIQSQLKSTNAKLKYAVSEIESKIYTTDIIEAVFSSTSVYIPEIFDKINKCFLPLIDNMDKLTIRAVENLSTIATKLALVLSESVDFKAIEKRFDIVAEKIIRLYETPELKLTMDISDRINNIPKSLNRLSSSEIEMNIDNDEVKEDEFDKN